MSGLGAGYSNILEALNNQNQFYTNTNPWLSAGRSISGVNVMSQDADPWVNALAQIGTSFAGGLMQGYGQSQVLDKQQELGNKLAQALASDAPIVALKEDPDLANIAPIVESQQQARKQEMQDKIVAALATQQIQNPLLTQQAGTPEVKMDPRGNLSVEFARPNVPTSPQPAKSESGLNFGQRESLQEKFNKRAMELRAMGLTPAQSAETARSELEGERKAAAGSFKTAEEARRKSQSLFDLATTAEAGVAGAGKTGPYNNILSAGAQVAALLGSEDQSQKLAAQKYLDSIAPELVKMNRSPGAVSDYESKMYIGAGPNKMNTPEQNAVLIERMKDIARIEGDYADFLESYRDQMGTTAGAGQLWQQYTRQFPLFVKQGDGIELNRSRPSWQEYFGGEAQQVAPVQQQQAPSITGNQAPVAPQQTQSPIAQAAQQQFEVRTAPDGRRYKVLVGQ